MSSRKKGGGDSQSPDTRGAAALQKKILTSASTAFKDETSSAKEIVAAAAHHGAQQAVGTGALALRLLFNVQLVPMLSFLLIFSVAILLQIFFDLLAPNIQARNLYAFIAGLVVIVCAFVLLYAVLRSFVHLAIDPFHSIEHAVFLSKLNRLGLPLTLVLAVTEAVLGLALLRRVQASGWEIARHLEHVMVAVVAQIAAAAFSAFSDGVSFGDLVRARTAAFGRQRHATTVAAWSTTLLRGKFVGLLCCLFAGWREHRLSASVPAALSGAFVCAWGQGSAFAALWFGMELLLLLRYLFSTLGYLFTWIRAAAVTAVALWAQSELAGSPAPLIIVPSAAAVFWAYGHYIHTRRNEGRSDEAADRDDAAGEAATAEHVSSSRDGQRVAAVIKAIVFLIMAGTATLLVVTAAQMWRQQSVPPVYTVAADSASMRLTHEGFGHPQSATALAWASAAASASAAPLPGAARRHAMCGMDVGHADLNAFDVGLMAQFSYLVPGSADVALVSSALFPDWEITTPGQGEHGVWFYDFYSPSRNLSVIAVRGTNPDVLQDVVQDLDVWYVAALLQAARALPTTLSLWPSTLLAEVARAVDLAEGLFALSNARHVRHYHAPVAEYVAAIEGSRQVVLTGHSLGAGIAKIVGALRGHKAISFSGPGLVLSRHKLALSLAAIQEWTLSFVPTNDFVPAIDEQTGTVVAFECPWDSAVLCHDPMMTLCHVFARCGSRLHASKFASCDFVPWTPEPAVAAAVEL